MYILANTNNVIIFHESNIQPCKKTCNLAETWSIYEIVFHYKTEKKHVPLNLVAYLIHKTHKMTNKKNIQSQKQSILNL